eukprot:11210012-Lingulodinium_polyedra.AAC.1
MQHTGFSRAQRYPMAGRSLLGRCLGTAWGQLGRRLNAGARVLLGSCLGAARVKLKCVFRVLLRCCLTTAWLL